MIRFWILILLTLGGVMNHLFGVGADAGELKKLWGKVSLAEEKKLPKTAIGYLKEIIEATKDTDFNGHYIKALCKVAINEAMLNGKTNQEKIEIIAKFVNNASEKDRPFLKSILAIWFWEYHDMNRWKFSSRDKTAGLEDLDFTTWDSNKLYLHVRNLFEEALQDPNSLKEVSLNHFQPLVMQGSLGFAYCQTVYEFVVREYLRFLTDSFSSSANPQNPFELDVTTPVFADLDSFLFWKVKTQDQESNLYRAVLQYQNLLSFLKERGYEDALLETDLQRLLFAKNKSVGGMISHSYEKALSEFVQRWEKNPISTLALAELARMESGKQEYLKALEYCQKAYRISVDADGSKLCRNLEREIQQKSFEVKVESNLNSFNREAFVSYRNITTMNFRVIRANWRTMVQKKWANLGEWLEEEEVEKLLRAKSVLQWSSDLPKTVDFKERTQKIAIPQLENGFYWIVASESPVFSRGEGNQISYSSFWVTDTTLLTRNLSRDIEALLVDSRDGNPLSGREIEFWKRGEEGRYLYEKTVKTDESGKALFPWNGFNRHDSYLLYAKSETGDVLFHDPLSFGYRNEKTNSAQTRLFTDRKLYRPGQTLYFKGVVLQGDHKNLVYKIGMPKSVVVALRDANYKEVARESFSVNEFGSFSGQFFLPRNVLAGNMTLQASYPSGSVSVQMEEYKRPKFEVEILDLEKQFQLNQEVEVEGFAKSYSGVMIEGAQVRYRVSRQVRMPWWWRWGYFSGEPAQEIAFGRVVTDDAGKFKISFLAAPDRKVPVENDPSFEYLVEVDVVDPAGETRSASKSIRLGYKAIDLKLSVSEWLVAEDKLRFDVSSDTLDGKPVLSRGEVVVYELIQPDRVVRKPSSALYDWWPGSKNQLEPDFSDFRNWKSGEERLRMDYEALDGRRSLFVNLSPGAYRVVAKTKDQYGKEVECSKEILVFSKTASSFVKVPAFFQVKNTNLSIGENFEAVFASGYHHPKAYFSLIRDGKILKQWWSDGKSQTQWISIPISEKLKGGFTFQSWFVRENQIYSENIFVNVPYQDKELKITLQSFREKLAPGQKENFRVKITGFDESLVNAELLAAMYDSSLDAFMPHSWSSFMDFFWRDSQALPWKKNLFEKQFHNWHSQYYFHHEHVDRSFPYFSHEIRQGLFPVFPLEHRMYGRVMSKSMHNMEVFAAMPTQAMMDREEDSMSLSEEKAAPAPSLKKAKADMNVEGLASQSAVGGGRAPLEKKKPVQMRTNLSETAFFYPHLKTDENGEVSIEFEAPQALTRWKLMLLSHTKELQSSVLVKTLVTQKELMVQPNFPRFLREGDDLFLNFKVTNLSAKALSGEARIVIFDARNGKEVTKEFIQASIQNFSLQAGKSSVASFRILVSDCNFPLQYRITAQTENFSDGEEGILPVLSRKILVRESTPLWIRGNSSRKVSVTKLLDSASSQSLSHHQLVLQMTSNPMWYALQALPWLSEFPHECTEQVFNRYYANLLGGKVIQERPEVERIFKIWQSEGGALKSNLEKNEDLKTVLLQETPWVMEAENEGESKKKIANFFDSNHLKSNLDSAMAKLRDRQLSDGSFTWFPGGRSSQFITMYLISGFGRLRHLGANPDLGPILRSLDWMDEWMHREYQQLKKHSWLNRNNFSQWIGFYLYGRSFFLKDHPVQSQFQEAVDYWLNQAVLHWNKLGALMPEAQTALGLNRFGKSDAVVEMMASFRERAKHDEEMGMFYPESEESFWWYRAPIETHAMMIEAFTDLGGTLKEIEDLKIWLLKQKQTQAWKTSKATSDAVYALLLRGENLLKSDKLVQVSLAGVNITPETAEAGTGFYEKRYDGRDVKAEMGQVQLRKEDDGIAWGGIFWQYFENIDKITPHDNTPLSLQKSIFVKRNTQAGPEIRPIEKEKIEVGDTLVVRVVLRSDRDMEFVHMKDQRGSGTEPVNVISRYKYQDGLGYYESTKDTASHFYFDYLSKGTYVFEYELKVFHKGVYQSGMCEIQSMYAPEFNSHSRSFEIRVD